MSDTNLSSGLKTVGMFKCFQCNYKGNTAKDLKDHYLIHRTENPNKCFQCEYEATDSKDLERHSLEHLDTLHNCPKCEFRDQSIQNIINHIKSNHKQHCICGQYFKYLKDFESHLNDNDECKDIIDYEEVTETVGDKSNKVQLIKEEIGEVNDPVFVCQICFFIFRSDKHLEDHLSNVHMKESKNMALFKSEMFPPKEAEFNEAQFFLCGECHYIFSSREALNEHITIHDKTSLSAELDAILPSIEIEENLLDEVEYVCYICDKGFASERSVKLHMNHHEEVKFRCPTCGLSMTSHETFKKHLVIHPPSDHDCFKCRRVFKTSAAYKQHMIWHELESFNCPLCEFSSSSKYDIKKHFKTCEKLIVDDDDDMSDMEIDQELYECPICEQRNFSSRTELRNHAKEIHLGGGSMQFACEDCHFTSSRKSELNAHKKVHSSSFKCVSCPYETKLSKEFEEHMLTHVKRDPSKRRIKPTFKVRFGNN